MWGIEVTTQDPRRLGVQGERCVDPVEHFDLIQPFDEPGGTCVLNKITLCASTSMRVVNTRSGQGTGTLSGVSGVNE